MGEREGWLESPGISQRTSLTTQLSAGQFMWVSKLDKSDTHDNIKKQSGRGGEQSRNRTHLLAKPNYCHGGKCTDASCFSGSGN